MEPLVFEPYLRPQIWGGRRLADWGKHLPSHEMRVGECWELSGHLLHASRVSDGPLAGRSVSELWTTERPSLAGDDPGLLASDRFPWLVKLLNCEAPLSVQVHPSQRHAKQWGLSEPGKSEAWVVLHAEPDAVIHAGLRTGIERTAFEASLAASRVEESLNRLSPEAGDCLYLPSGTVHSAQGGLVLLEVQSTSDATFRLWDWDRLDERGHARPLHRETGLDLVEWGLGPLDFVRAATTLPLGAGVTRTQLIDCPEFVLHRYDLTRDHRPTELAGKLAVWFVAAGSVTLQSGAMPPRTLMRGQTVLVPATSRPIHWEVPPEGATLLEFSL